MLLDFSILLAVFTVAFVIQFADRRWFVVPLGRLFVIGMLIGATWEVPLYLSGPRFLDNPMWTMGSPYPMHPLVLPVTHSILDGALFLVGLLLVKIASPGKMFETFSRRDLGLLVAYGLIQAAMIEWVALSADAGWQYTMTAWNPGLFWVAGKPFTALPLMIWFAAPIAYYFIALRMSQCPKMVERRQQHCPCTVEA
ncbi:MAG: hypothetical protein AAGI89_08150 [Pseudomonadota bacterium]